MQPVSVQVFTAKKVHGPHRSQLTSHAYRLRSVCRVGGGGWSVSLSGTVAVYVDAQMTKLEDYIKFGVNLFWVPVHG